ncbi:MAG TPA: HisA/HisF-related TIM barrel protein [Candidatus Acidoferrum sp.]|nr:HisA/HisF-related TIM barrel protein [Candidatus Acidoferrum sp.]
MDVIPVIDLKGGAVVHAQRGDRDSYRPVRSQLCATSEPADVVAGLLAVYPFATLYIADLDAIHARGNARTAIRDIRRRFPEIRLWVDNGLAEPAACRDWLAEDLSELVLGSEAQRDAAVLTALSDDDVRQHLILSLDYGNDRFLGPPDLLAARSLWPERIIVMTLSRVGSRGGPDLDLLRRWRDEAPAKKIFAAGGVRGGEDLLALADCGISGVLVATALHERRIGRAEIAAVDSDAA